MIREAQMSDLEVLVRLNKEEMGYDYPIEQTKINLEKILNDPQHKILVAVKDHQVVGYVHAVCYDLLYFDHLKNIMGIAVDHRYRRQHIGHDLLTAIEKWAKETGAKGVRLVSGETRKEAHAFYIANGYQGNKQQRNFKKMWS